MAYYFTESFAAGVDLRKHPLTAAAGSLRVMDDCHVNPGGEIEKRLAFVEAFDVAGTVGLAQLGDVLYTFGTSLTGPSGTFGDLTLVYMQLTGTTDTLLDMKDWDVFDGKLYVVMKTDGTTEYQHFYDGVIVPGGLGIWIRTYQSKMYSVRGKNIYFSAVNDPTEWADTAKGAGFINTSVNDAEATNLSGLEVYYNGLAVFSTSAIQIWEMDPDPQLNLQKQVIRSMGLAGNATPRQYAAGDILFLSPTGIRSLQAKDSSNSGSINDIGSPIDKLIQDTMREEKAGYLKSARSILSELTGRFWMSFPDQIWVLSLFPGPKVSAWSRYLPTDENGASFRIEDMVDADGHICLRGVTDKIYVFGGADKKTYDDTASLFQLSYLDFGQPATVKQLLAFDAAVDASWLIEASMDPDNLVWEQVGTIMKSSYVDQSFGLQGYTPAVSIRMTSQNPVYSRVANIAVHYLRSKED